jgi:predicted GIY-YIG superfamily endonuclease
MTRVNTPPMPYYVYMLASKKNGVLYIGITNDLIRRVYEHKTNAVKSFTSRYNVHVPSGSRFTMIP